MRSSRPSLDIVAAMNHPQLFAPWFPGPSWDHWRIVLKAAFALPMSGDEREFFNTVAKRMPPGRPVRELWCVVGRGGGKDSVASLIAAHAGALFDQQYRLRRGERALVMCLACDRDQARIVLGYTRSYFADIPPLKAMVRRETSNGFELDNGVDIAIATNSYRAVRGRTLLCAILDETAFWHDERSATPDEETYRAIGPGLARLPSSILVGISTPYRKNGLLYRKFSDHYGRDGEVLVIKAPSLTFNPTLDQTIIDQALAEDPVAARAEWLAEFRDDLMGWATRELIEAAVDRGVTVRPPASGIVYRSFCDPSGGQKDSFTAAIAHAENGVAVLDCLVEIKPPFNPDTATAQVADVLKAYRCRSTVGDKYAAQWVVQAFRKCGINYQYSERDRSLIYLDALPLFTTGRARLLDNKRLVHQFASLERRTSPVGKDRVDHGPSGVDDACNSAAGAMVLAVSHQPLIISPAVLAKARIPAPHIMFRQRALF
jgi:hypothetical protein